MAAANGQAHPRPNLLLKHHDALKDLQVNGIDGYGYQVSKPYIPYESLVDYWDVSSVREVIGHLHDNPPIQTIRERYLRVFSTLVFVGKVDYITGFTRHNLNDDIWPRDKPDSPWPPSYAASFFDEFCAAQWMFFPLQFERTILSDQRLAAQYILPIDSVQDISSRHTDETTKMLKITINKSYNKLVNENDWAVTNTFLFKTYDLGSGISGKAYSREKEAYSVIELSGPSEHVVRYYGSFEQRNTGYLVLEFVDGSTLEHYLREHNSPQTATDVHDFWSSIAGLPESLHKLHQSDEVSSVMPQKVIIHQDLILSNILVVKDPVHPYKFLVKLVDFGHSSTTRTKEGQPVKAWDNRGTMTHAAPETTRHAPIFRNGPSLVTRSSDVWSLGCVMFKLVAWVADGWDNIVTFDTMRTEELRHFKGFTDSGFSKTFHNGAGRLHAVDEAYRQFKSQLSENNADNITAEILDIASRHMLENESHKRMPVKQIMAIYNDVLDKLNPGLEQDDNKYPMAAPPAQPPTDRQRDLQPNVAGPQFPVEHLTIGECVEWRNAILANRPPNSRVQSVINTLKDQLKKREYLFLIDDSQSMQKYHAEVVDAFTGLAYVAKEMDPNGIELAFLSSPRCLYQRRSIRNTTTDLIKKVQRLQYTHDPRLTEMKLGEFFDEAVISKLPNWSKRISKFYRKKPLTLFVFTDGVWDVDSSRKHNVQYPINKLVDQMKERGVLRPNVAIQLVRFGDDPNGKEYLDHLDNRMGSDR